MKLLYVVPQPPAAQGGAADRCTLGAVRALVRQGIDVRVLAAQAAFTPDFARPDLPHLDVVPVGEASGWTGRIDSVVRPGTALARSAFGEHVRAAAQEGVDAVQLDQIETGRILDRSGSGMPPSVLSVHYRAAFDRPFGPPWRRPFRHVLELHRAERAAISEQRWLTANTTRVADSLRRLAARADVRVIPLTLDADDYVVGPAPKGAPTAGMIGNAQWPPTAAAFDRLTHQVWPRVFGRVPNAELAIAGRGTGNEVPDASAFLRGLHVLLYPVERGSGMKVKVLEALALGIPVVTTREGAEGVPPSDGVIVASADADIAASAARILADPAERAQRSAAARATFDNSLSPAVVGELLVALYEEMIAAG